MHDLVHTYFETCLLPLAERPECPKTERLKSEPANGFRHYRISDVRILAFHCIWTSKIQLRFKFQTPNDDFSDKEARVSVTLLEYGHVKNVVAGGSSQNDDKNF